MLESNVLQSEYSVLACGEVNTFRGMMGRRAVRGDDGNTPGIVDDDCVARLRLLVARAGLVLHTDPEGSVFR